MCQSQDRAKIRTLTMKQEQETGLNLSKTSTANAQFFRGKHGQGVKPRQRRHVVDMLYHHVSPDCPVRAFQYQ